MMLRITRWCTAAVVALVVAGCATTVEDAPAPAVANPPLSTASGQSVEAEQPAGSQERDITGATADEMVEQYGMSQVGGIGDLLVAPTRIIFDGDARFAQLSLVNIGTRPATYRISFSELEMNSAGELKTIEDPDQAYMPASRVLRYSPRQIILQPNVAQTVRLQSRKPADLPDGEYRSHLLFRAIPAAEPGEQDEAGETGGEEGEASEGLSVNLVPLYGITIPVIVRHGETSVTAGLEGLELKRGSEDQPDVLALRITREGNQSVYGSLTVTHHPESGSPHIVGQINGLGVYTPLPYRTIEIPLNRRMAGNDDVAIEGGHLEVELRQGEGGGDEILARNRLDLP